MSKKDKRLKSMADSQVKVGTDQYEGYVLSIGKKSLVKLLSLTGKFIS